MLDRKQTISTATVLLNAILFCAAYAKETAPSVAFKSESGKVAITIGGEPFTTYYYDDPKIPRPYQGRWS